MPKYYHIHRGIEPSELENKFIKNQPLFFSKYNSIWYNSEKSISYEYGGRSIYQIYIPKKRFTFSFDLNKKRKIVKITKDNIKEYIELRKKFLGHSRFIEEMNKRNIIGVDATDESIYDQFKFGDPEGGEGYIWISKDIRIKLIERKIYKK